MNILCIGDPHFKVSNPKETRQLYFEIEKILNKYRFDLVVVLGDVLDTHERIHMSVHKRACEFLLMISRYVETYVLVGNHDRVNNQDFMTDIHPFTGLERENLHIVWKTQKIKFSDKFIFFVPYVPPGKFEKALEAESFDPETAKLIFAHQEFRGCKMGAIVSQEGDEWPEDYPEVISGHIHDYQKLGNITYAGTPFQHGFSDSIDKKLMAISIKENKIKKKRIEIDVIRKRAVTLTLEEFDDYEPLDNCITKVYIRGDSKVIRDYLKSNQERLNDYDLKVCIRDTSHEQCLPENKQISFEDYIKDMLGEDLYLKFSSIVS